MCSLDRAKKRAMRAAAGVLVLLTAAVAPLGAQAAGPARNAESPAETAIRATMAAQVAAWNRGNIDGFMQGYAHSPETTFIGSTIAHGYAPILARYHAAYRTQAEMGTLRFDGLAVRLLPCAGGGAEYAVVTGRFHLTRAQHGAAARDDGVFDLIWHHQADGWRIILDHTS